ncbi:MAG: hypothetical protein IT242_08160 [Bacteroidia bacterium]|nr:hypothetical protein [Bacteroidia bacterium]
MSRKIENIRELQAEIRRLKEKSSGQEEAIRHQLKELHERLKPENILMHALSSITGIKIKSSEFFRNGIAIGITLLLQRFIFKTEATLEKKIYDWVDKIFDKVREFLNTLSSRGPEGSSKIDAEA